MKIETTHIPQEGIALLEEIAPAELDVETDIIKFRGPIKIKADVTQITNAITVNINLTTLMYANCSRCLKDVEINFKKNTVLNYSLSKEQQVIDLDPDIREEIILDYPINPLCSLDCKGLCPKCGINLNERKCSCV